MIHIVRRLPPAVQKAVFALSVLGLLAGALLLLG